MLKTNIERLARKARHDLDHRCVDIHILEKLYKNYNTSIENVPAFICSAMRMFPKSNCGVASLYLKNLCNSGILVKGKYDNINHTFLMWGKDLIADITADQFGGPKVYVGPLQRPWSVPDKLP